MYPNFSRPKRIHRSDESLLEDLFDQLEDEPLDLLGSFKSVNSRKTQKRRKTSDSGWAGTGNAYASKKAGGDLRKKDKLETYAYWPLDRKMMSRRPEHRAAAWKGMARVVKMTKKLEGKSASTVLSMKLINFNCQKKGSKRKSRESKQLSAFAFPPVQENGKFSYLDPRTSPYGIYSRQHPGCSYFQTILYSH
ncbi:RRP12-like protein [Populus alba x Populus x berolinensis]|nr:RRP12-like protein [Populus alba x Populus x berolinensis]